MNLNVQTRAREAEEEKEKAYKQIENLKRKYEDGELTKLPLVDEENDQHLEGEFEKFYVEDEELTKLPEPSSWFSGYDSCNI